MKIIIIDKTKQFRLIPDSALLLKHRPFFRPDYVQNLQAKTALVVKFNRLGKYIQEKFASTYYDEIGFAINFYDKNCLDDLIQKGLPWERATCFDGSFALSEFVKISEISDNSVEVENFRPLQSAQSQPSSQKQTFPFDLCQIPAIISELSTFMTLKIGDYIAIELGEISSVPFEINDVLQLSLNGKNRVRVTIK
jgi:2-keto-4-pentenoate hydratase/2-oxohepta-3-ene-1,7-dioic acid hydratase in catechol pathway